MRSILQLSRRSPSAASNGKRPRAIFATAALALCAISVIASAQDAGDGLLRRGGFPYGAFERADRIALRMGGGSLEVAFAPGALDLPRGEILAWVEESARAVVLYYGRLPDPHARVLIVPVSGRGVRGGTTYGHYGAATRIQLGASSTRQDLERDWVLVHELVHHAFPMLADNHHWLEEGLATYVEPIARAQAGGLSVEKVWRDLVEGLPNGLPDAGDRGLDRTPTWGRTYWGGALFCLLADIEIRERTGNRKGLQDALRAIVAAGGKVSRSWTIERALEVGDDATGVSVLAELYQRMKHAPAPVDLEQLWVQLGVQRNGAQLQMKEDAPRASIRRAITDAHAVSGG